MFLHNPAVAFFFSTNVCFCHNSLSIAKSVGFVFSWLYVDETTDSPVVQGGVGLFNKAVQRSHIHYACYPTWAYTVELYATPEVIRTVLLFVFFGWWILWRYVAKRGATTITERTKQNVHPKKKLSWFRQAWEELQRLRLTPHLLPGG